MAERREAITSNFKKPSLVTEGTAELYFICGESFESITELIKQWQSPVKVMDARPYFPQKMCLRID